MRIRENIEIERSSKKQEHQSLQFVETEKMNQHKETTALIHLTNSMKIVKIFNISFDLQRFEKRLHEKKSFSC